MTAFGQAELDRVMRFGRRVVGRGFVLYADKIRVFAKPRIVVSQKVDKRSVVRHKIKRRLRHIVHGAIPSGWGIVVVTNQQIVNLPFPELFAAVRFAIKSLV